MKRSVLIQALNAALGDQVVTAAIERATSLPEIAKMAAVECFLANEPDLTDETIRKYLVELNEKGCFIFDSE